MEQKLSEQRASPNAEPATGEGQRLIYVMSADAARADAADELDFLRLWRIVWQSRWLIATITALTAILALVYALSAKEWYTAEALLIPAAPDSSQGGLSGQLGGLAGLASSLAGISLGNADSTEPLAVLRSPGFTRDFIEEHGLLTVLFADKWDATQDAWKSPSKAKDIHDAVKYFDEDVRRIKEDKKTGLVTVTIEWTDRNVAADWANLLVKDLNDRMRQRSLVEAEANLDYLKRELSAANVVTLQQSIGRLLETELQKVMMARGKGEFAFRVVDSAAAPKWRSSPKRIQVLVLATVLGVILGVVIAFLRNAVRESRTTRVASESS
jgi:LPS O-antigen subunit length determinant protein (WzzB/FepE family)